MKISNPKNLVPEFFANTSESYDKVVILTTFGKDKYWKNEILNNLHGTTFLDLACGTGILTRKIAKKFPNSKIIGLDITENYLKIAKKNSSTYKNISFIHQDAEQLTLETKFDCIVSSYIPKYCNPDILIPLCVSHLNPGGKIVLHDFIYPQNSVVEFFWSLYFVMLNFIGNFIPAWKKAFRELPNLIKSSSWLESYENVMKANGLDVKSQHFTWNTSAILIGKKHI